MAVRIEMQIRRVAQLSLLSVLFALASRSVADAQSDAGAAAPSSAQGAPPAAPPATPGTVPSPATPSAPSAQPGASPPPAGFSPEASPLVPADSPPGSAQQAPYPQQASPQQAPVYPQPYAPPPQQPGYYGNYPPPSGYAPQPTYPLANEYTPNEGARKHDGFFLRMKVGIGAGGARYEERVYEPEVSTVKTRGLAGNFELAIGGSIVENFILHGNLALTAMSSNKKVDDVTDSTYDRLSTAMWLLGGGGTYYIMPTNLYVTLVLGVAGITESRYLDAQDDYSYADIRSGAGFGSSLSLGKEWWVGRTAEWGLGAAITGSILSAPVRIGELSTRFLGHSITVNFSATFN